MGILFVQFFVYICSNRYKNLDFKGSLGILLFFNIIKFICVEFFFFKSWVYYILNIQFKDMIQKLKLNILDNFFFNIYVEVFK